MCPSNGSTVNQANNRSWGPCMSMQASSKANWSGFNIAAMVFSFVFFWPIGLLVLFWILSGREARDLPAAIADKWRSFRAGSGGFGEGSTNVVFNDFQQTQYDRINEIKHEIKQRSERFNAFRADAKRRADQEEFNRFMADSPEATNK